MDFDIVIGGVGGQGVLTLAWLLDHAAAAAQLYLKQSEVHGMAQRGGAVSAYVRLSDQPLASDLIPDGSARLIIGVEPLEALRYARLLAPDGWIVTDLTPLINQDNYPALPDLYRVLLSAPQVLALDATRLAKQAGNIKAQNVVVLGAATPFLPLSPDAIETQLHALFSAKGERAVHTNLSAYRLGLAAGNFYSGLRSLGVPCDLISSVIPKLALTPDPVPQACVQAWARRLLAADGVAYAGQVFAAESLVTLDSPLLQNGVKPPICCE
ncbi:MAG: hypothetical protein OHK0048_00100 [Rhodoferax sp.]